MLQRLFKRSPECELMDFGQLLGYGYGAVGTHDFGHFLQRLQQPVRRLVKHDGFLHFSETLQKGLLTLFVGQEAVEVETAAGESGLDEGGHESGGARQALDLNILFQGLAHEQETGV